jgi:4-hydroxybenzoate polyprenyltransferase
LPVRWGTVGSLRFARLAHGVMLAALAGFGLVAGLGWIYGAGWVVIAACLAAQHGLAGGRDPVRLNTAFFHMNVTISLVLLAAVVADVALRR